MRRSRLFQTIVLLAASIVAFTAPSVRAQSQLQIPYFERQAAFDLRVHLKVICNGQVLTGLTPPQFTFRDNNIPFTGFTMVKPATAAVPTCADVAIVIDRSASMASGTPRLIDQVKTAATRFVDSMIFLCDQTALVTYANDIALDAFLTNDRAKVKQKIGAISTGGASAMWDASYLALQELYISGIQPTRAAILITNSTDTKSISATAADVIAFARSNNILLYSIVVGTSADTVAMRSAAVRTGGRSYQLQSGTQLNATLDAIRRDIREQAMLSYFEFSVPQSLYRKHIFEFSTSACAPGLTVRTTLDLGSGINNPAPFTLSTASIRNTDLFRIDHTGCNSPNEFALDTLRLRWQPSRYNDPFLDEPTTYRWTALVDSAGVTVPVSFPADTNGRGTTVTLNGLTLFNVLLKRGAQLPADSLVMRIPWFVTAMYAGGGTVNSDTAGISIRSFTAQQPATPAIVLSVNRAPSQSFALIPRNDSTVIPIRANSTVNLRWTLGRDVNIDRGELGSVFRTFDAGTRRWIKTPNRTVDTLTPLIQIKVIETVPANRGAAVGSTFTILLARNADSARIDQAMMQTLFGNLIDTTKGAMSVRIQWTVLTRDFNFTNAVEQVTFDSIWSGLGCRPHLSASESHFLILVRDTTKGPTTIGDVQPSDFLLEQNYPNPWSASTTIQLHTPALNTSNESSKNFTLKVYDLLGREVLDLSDQIMRDSRVTIHRSQLPGPGVYFYRLTGGNYREQRNMILLE